LPDVISGSLFFESERGECHRVEAFADAGITGSKFPRFLQRDLLPKTREMKNAKWTGNAGTDQWNVCFSHSTNFGNPGTNGMQVSMQTETPPDIGPRLLFASDLRLGQGR
jgi:hypothetical protein